MPASMHEDISVSVLYTTEYLMALKFRLIEHRLRKWLLSNVMWHLLVSWLVVRSFLRAERFHVYGKNEGAGI